MTCFYCDELLTGNFKAPVLMETKLLFAFEHTQPYFERHVVIVPKEHMESLSVIEATNPELAVAFMQAIQQFSAALEKEYGGCYVRSGVGSYQNSPHLHWVLYAGERLRNDDGSPA